MSLYKPNQTKIKQGFNSEDINKEKVHKRHKCNVLRKSAAASEWSSSDVAAHPQKNKLCACKHHIPHIIKTGIRLIIRILKSM